MIESMLALTIGAVLIASGLPAFSTMQDKSRLTTAAETLRNDFHYAINEVRLEGNREMIHLSFNSDGRTDWCYGLTIGDSCDCRVDNAARPDACIIPVDGRNELRVVNSADFDHVVRMPDVQFEKNRARIVASRSPSQAGKVSFSAAGRQIDVALTPMGRVRLCSSANADFGSC